VPSPKQTDLVGPNTGRREREPLCSPPAGRSLADNGLWKARHLCRHLRSMRHHSNRFCGEERGRWPGFWDKLTRRAGLTHRLKACSTTREPAPRCGRKLRPESETNVPSPEQTAPMGPNTGRREREPLCSPPAGVSLADNGLWEAAPRCRCNWSMRQAAIHSSRVCGGKRGRWPGFSDKLTGRAGLTHRLKACSTIREAGHRCRHPPSINTVRSVRAVFVAKNAAVGRGFGTNSHGGRV
jgi:hypothetical protein